jgi:hypothetical protein
VVGQKQGLSLLFPVVPFLLDFLNHPFLVGYPFPFHFQPDFQFFHPV